MKIYESKHNSTLKLIWFNEIVNRPNLTSYLAMRQDYSPDPIYLKYDQFVNLSEEELGERVYRLAVNFNHFGILEHSGLVFNIVGFPHDVPMQHRTHRVGVSFDVMSQRYTGQHFVKYYEKHQVFDDLFIRQYFYFPKIGTKLISRDGCSYYYSANDLIKDCSLTRHLLEEYVKKVQKGYPEEVARRSLPQGIRQHYIFSCNPRSLEHLLDVRSTKDVQLEFRVLSELFMEFYEEFNPVLAKFYKERRYQKNKLAP